MEKEIRPWKRKRGYLPFFYQGKEKERILRTSVEEIRESPEGLQLLRKKRAANHHYVEGKGGRSMRELFRSRRKKEGKILPRREKKRRGKANGRGHLQDVLPLTTEEKKKKRRRVPSIIALLSGKENLIRTQKTRKGRIAKEKKKKRGFFFR